LLRRVDCGDYRAVLAYVLRRILASVPVVIGVATMVFALIHAVPGDPAQAMLGETASAADIAALRTSLGLDKPLLVQYARYLRGLGRADLGTSFRFNTPVSREIGARLGATTELALAAVLVGVVVALPLGVVGALFREGPIDRVTSLLSLAGISVPAFWLGPMLALVFAVELGWLPVSGRGTWAQLVLPAVTLGAALAAGLARMTRASVGIQLDERYVTAAYARGLPVRRAVYHAFRNSLIPVVTILGLQLGVVLTGTVITETIFAWPGVGRLLIQAIYGRDYPLVQGCILFIAVTYVAMNLLVDVTYAWLDPRVRLR
jgi:ABC-type dipeptide/oligopeptide/nickel transport system permease component